jgi:protein-S-isoprenylcysteine O-methyltransferase Ste14
MGLIEAVYGLICYVIFLGSFLYAIGFVGDLVVPKTIDSGPGASFPEALAVDIVLLGLFAVQHSVVARTGFKAVWTRIVPRSVERSTYVLASSLLLALICWKWQAIPAVVWQVTSPAVKALLLALFAMGWLILLLSTFMINHFDLFGLRQVYLRRRGVDYTPLNFKQRAFYNFVRHPIMLGFIIAFWAAPHMSASRVFDRDDWLHLGRDILRRARPNEVPCCGVRRLSCASPDAVSDGRQTGVIGGADDFGVALVSRGAVANPNWPAATRPS